MKTKYVKSKYDLNQHTGIVLRFADFIYYLNKITFNLLNYPQGISEF